MKISLRGGGHSALVLNFKESLMTERNFFQCWQQKASSDAYL